ncbi:MAG TPA: response regulator [Candidatus Omnitrophota bacterium]|nr:response regulator [Candidatus Omnitrophota bacterium]
MAGQNKKILVIDDDKGFLKMVRVNLINSGFDVLTADTGEKGIQLAQKKNPDLILLDVLLPGIKGREVCVKLKQDKATSSIPVMFLTAKDSPDDVKAEMEVGAVTHLTKPVDLKRLILEIKHILNI